MTGFTPVENFVNTFIDHRRQEIINFAIQLIETPTHNPPGNEIAAAKVAEKHLQNMGFEDITILEPKPKRGNLICTFDTGQQGPTLILNGHLDTKPPIPRESWVTDPYQGVLRDGKLFGLGATDMKGPDAALVYGLAAAANAGDEAISGNVLLVLSADEEHMALEGPRYLVQEKGIRGDAALIAEPIGVDKPWQCIPLISRGISCLRWKVKGTQSHSSTSDRLPTVNASLEACRLMVFLEENLELTYPPTPLCPLGPTVNLGATIQGGQAYAMVSGEAEFVIDIRTLPGMTKAQLITDIDQVTNAFRKQNPRVDVSWEFLPGTLAWTQPTEISPQEPLVSAVKSAAEVVLGHKPPLGYFPGGTDAIWWQGAGDIPTIPGFGPGLLPNCHQPNEYIVVEEILQAAKIYALTILNYLGGNNGDG